MHFFRLLLLYLVPFYVSAHPLAQRVITLSPHATELAYSSGLGSKLIAVSEASDYPRRSTKNRNCRQLSRDKTGANFSVKTRFSYCLES